MALVNVTTVIDSHVRQDRPADVLAGEKQLEVDATGAAVKYAFMYFVNPLPAGAVVISATLKFYLRDAWTGGPHTVTAKRVTTAWKESTLTYNEQPAVTATNAGSVVVSAGAADKTLVLITLTAMLQDVAAGQTWHGVRLEVNTNGIKKIRAVGDIDGLVPFLEITYAVPPGMPDNLSPSGGRSTSPAQPTVTWRYQDPGGSAQSDAQVQIDDVSDFLTPLWDSGLVARTEPNMQLGMGLTDGVTYWMRVRTKSADGLTSPWSDPVSFRRDTKGALAITAPAGATVNETTPTFTHSLTGRVQEATQHLLEEQRTDGTWKLLHDSGRRVTGSTTYSIPAGLITSPTKTYRLTIRVWDTIDREATPGDPPYLEQTKTFTYVVSGTPAPVTALTATVVGAGVQLQWNRSTQPDFFAIKVDGVYVDPRVPAASAFVSGTTYRWTIYGVTPAVQHTFDVEAVVLTGGQYLHSSGAA